VRILVVATIIMAFAAPAFAQGSNKHHGMEKKKNEPPKIQANEKDYKAALDRLPQQKHDPWGAVRSTGDKR
jgi:hypothetical protein